MMMMSNLPNDLVEEILSRVPFKYLRAVRSTCKKWNVLSKTWSFVNKHIDKAAVSGEKEFLVITEFSVSLIGVNLIRDQNNNVDLSIKRKARLISRGQAKEVFSKSQIIHCKGVFLCIWGHMLVVLNPYWGQTKWIIPSPPFGSFDIMYALGYDKSCGSHKILRLFGSNPRNVDIYDLSSNSWMVPDDSLEPDIKYLQHGVSLKGDTYWYAIDQESRDRYLICFDFTSERFGPRLPLPFDEDFPGYAGNYVTLSAVKEEKLAVLLHLWGSMDIWVTNKIEPDAVSWSIFLKVDMKQSFHCGNFFIDEEKKVAVVCCRDRSENRLNTIYNRAYIIGENGYLKSVDLSESPNQPLGGRLVCSYIPSSMNIK